MKGNISPFLSKESDIMPSPLKIEKYDLPSIDFYDTDNNKMVGRQYFSTGESNYRRFYFVQFNADQDDNESRYAETFYLPSPSEGLTETTYYRIATTKERYINFPVGSCFMTTTNTNPSTILGGGTWSLISKRFAYKYLESGFVTFDTSMVNGGSTYAIIQGDTIEMRIDFQPLEAWDDSTYTIGTIDFDAIGVTGLTISKHALALSDGGQGACYCVVSASDGTIKCGDTIGVDGNDAITPEYTFSLPLHFNIINSRKLDSFCNQFIWKRTA